MAPSEPIDSPTPARVRPAWIYPIAGGFALVVGLLPWIVTGMTLPLQNLWATRTMPDDMPFALLPVSQCFLTSILAMIVTATAIAGSVARTAAPANRTKVTSLVLAGLLVTLTVAAAQSVVVVAGGLEQSSRATIYLAICVASIVLSTLVGVAVLALIALAPRPVASIGAALAAIAVSRWVSALVFLGLEAPYETFLWMSDVLRWLPAVLVGVALAWCGLGTRRQVAAWVAGLAVLWMAPAALTALAHTTGYRAAYRHPAELLDAGLDVFVRTLHPVQGGFAWSAVVALAVGALGTLLLRNRRAESARP